MKAKRLLRVAPALNFLLLSSLTPLSGLAQGSLAPSGAPAPTMKTLDQIEARVPISATPFKISNPGSSYLDYSLGYNNDVGPIGPAASATSPWANVAY